MLAIGYPITALYEEYPMFQELLPVLVARNDLNLRRVGELLHDA